MTRNLDNKRRSFLIQALTAGLFSVAGGSAIIQPAYALGPLSRKLPPGRSIYKLDGTVLVNNKIADINTPISANSVIKTESSSQIIFAVGSDAFILRSNSELKLGGTGELIDAMRMFTGRLLSVFGKRVKPHNIQTQTATIGIRGTGIYIESDLDKSYVCTCYGETSITSSKDPNSSVNVKTKHHDDPFYIYSDFNKRGKIIVPAPIINHTDAELELIEQLVGRRTPFVGINFGGWGDGGSY